MPKPYKIFYCPECQKDVSTHKEDRKDLCNKCGSSTRVRCWGIRFRIYEGNKLIKKNISGCRTEKDAFDDYLKFMSTYQKPSKHIDTPVYKLLFEDAYHNYLRVKASEVKQSSYYDNIKCFKATILPFFSGKIVTNITVQDIRDWQELLVEKGYAFKTKQKHRTYLNNLFEYLHREYNIPNIVERVKGFSKKLEVVAKKEMSIIEPDEYKTFEKAIPEQDIEDRTMFNILYLCQTRKGEMCALTWNDWLADKTKLDINKTFSRISFDETDAKYPIPKAEIIKEFICGKKSKYIIHSTKSINGVRKIDLPESTQNYLQKLYEIKSKRPGFSTEEFIIGKDGSYINYTTLSNRFEKFKKIAGIKKDIRVHDLRHSGVSMLINTYQSSSSNINTLQLEFIIAERIGDSVEQVIKTYGHLFKGMQSIIANSIKL